MATRLMNQEVKASNWEALLREAISLARATGDRRLPMLERALTSGQASTVLKRLGIIGKADLAREFSSQQT